MCKQVHSSFEQEPDSFTFPMLQQMQIIIWAQEENNTHLISDNWNITGLLKPLPTQRPLLQAIVTLATRKSRKKKKTSKFN